MYIEPASQCFPASGGFFFFFSDLFLEITHTSQNAGRFGSA